MKMKKIKGVMMILDEMDGNGNIFELGSVRNLGSTVPILESWVVGNEDSIKDYVVNRALQNGKKMDEIDGYIGKVKFFRDKNKIKYEGEISDEADTMKLSPVVSTIWSEYQDDGDIEYCAIKSCVIKFAFPTEHHADNVQNWVEI